MEVEVGVPLLGIYLDRIQAQFRVRQEESEAARAMNEAVQKVVWRIGVAEGEASGGMRRKGGLGLKEETREMQDVS